MRAVPRRLLAAAGALAAAGLLLPAAADWLVTRDGSRIETEGPWRVESRLVVFRQANGTLGSLRLSDVDLDASRRLTEEMAERAAAPPAEPEAPQRSVVARITERDLPPVEAGRDGAEEASAPAEGRVQEPSALDVTSFQEISGPTGDGVAFRGTVRNGSEHMAVGIAVTAVLFDESGAEVRRTDARLTSTALATGQSAGFRADFPGVYHYVRVEFEVAGNLLQTAPREDDEGAPEAAS